MLGGTFSAIFNKQRWISNDGMDSKYYETGKRWNKNGGNKNPQKKIGQYFVSNNNNYVIAISYQKETGYVCGKYK